MVDDVNVNQHPENVNFSASTGQRRRVLTADKVKEHALVQLGFPVVNVEIEPAQQGILMERTLDEFNKWLPPYKLDVLTTVSGRINQYDLRELNKPYGRGITDVNVVSQNQFFAPISGVFALGIPHPISHMAPDQYDLALRYIDASKKVYSSDMDWEWEEPILWLYAPQGLGGPFQASYMYIQDASQPEDIPTEDWGWFKDYFTALVKIAVGQARGKFGGIPGPAGQNLRGGELVSEGLDEKKALEADIRSKSYARVPPLFLGSKG
jgi:hypothetical protein